MSAKIVGIGANVFDTLITVPYFPTEDTKLKAESVKECGGGPCATGLVAAAKLGASAAYIGALAQDSGGTFLREDMERFGVDTSHTDSVPGAASFSSVVLLSKRDASRTCVFHKGALPGFVMDEDKCAAVREAEILMVDGNELEQAVCAAELAKQSGTRVLYDAGGRYEGIERLLPLADILIPSEEFALGVTGCKTAAEAAQALYDTYHPEVVIVTQGKHGGTMYDGSRVTEYPAFPVETVDSNGAGDVFHGAFAYALTEGFDYRQACIFSSAVSALKCTRLGARDGVPTRAETEKFIKERLGHEL